MPRAEKIVLMNRLCLAVLVVTVSILIVGLFGGVQASFGLTGNEAHALAFFALTALLLVALPRVRKWDVALITMALGGAFEVLLPGVGRKGTIFDFLADSIGVLIAVAPMTIASFRAAARQASHKPDRRRQHYRSTLQPNTDETPAA